MYGVRGGYHFSLRQERVPIISGEVLRTRLWLQPDAWIHLLLRGSKLGPVRGNDETNTPKRG